MRTLVYIISLNIYDDNKKIAKCKNNYLYIESGYNIMALIEFCRIEKLGRQTEHIVLVYLDPNSTNISRIQGL